MNQYDFSALSKQLKKGQVNACMIAQKGDLLFEHYRNKKAAANLHPIHSCSKSVVSMLLGICMRDGLITDIHTPLTTYFPQILAQQSDPRKQELTLYHLLTMTPGLDWPEFGAWNFGTPMEYSRDIVRFVLERDIDTPPGTKMIYNSGCSNLLSAVIGKVSGMKAADFAQKHLFSPLRIKDYVWYEKQNISIGANGLRMKAEDMLKLGHLYLHQGKLGKKQIIPADWVAASIQPRFETYSHIGHYGYHWWMSSLALPDGRSIDYYFAMGLFGQFIIVVPSFDLVTVFVSENYGDTLNPMHYFRESVLPMMAQA